LSTIDTNPDLIRWLLTTLAPDQSYEIDFQSIFMKVIWSIADYLSTIDTNLGFDQVVAHSFGTWSALKAKSH
jgi:hypothetical protein